MMRLLFQCRWRAGSRDGGTLYSILSRDGDVMKDVKCHPRHHQIGCLEHMMSKKMLFGELRKKRVP